MIRRFLADETGATAVEYGLIIAVLSLAVVAGMREVGNSIEDLWGNNQSQLNEAWKD